MFELAGRLDRTVVVDGDVVRLRTQWKSPKRGENGYLLGPEDINDREQRVYGFGSRGSQGAAWVIRRVSGTK